MDGKKSKIKGSLYIDIEFKPIDYGKSLSSYKESFFISKESLKYTKESEQENIERKSSSFEEENNRIEKNTKTLTFSIVNEDYLVTLLDAFRNGIFKENNVLNPFIEKEKFLSITITERMVQEKRLFFFDENNPYLLLSLWNFINNMIDNRVSDDGSFFLFPSFIERYSKSVRNKIENIKYYQELMNSIAASCNVKDSFEKVNELLKGNIVEKIMIYDYRFDSIIDKGRYILFNNKGIHFNIDEIKEHNDTSIIMLNHIRLLAFLKKYADTFKDINELERLYYKDNNKDFIGLMHSFFEDVYGFSTSYNLTSYLSIFKNDSDVFDAVDRPVLDLFYYVLYIVRHEHGAYDPIGSVIDTMKNYKCFSTISIHDAINKIIDVQENKKYYVVSGVLYCCYNYMAYRYHYKGYWEKCDYTTCIDDYLHGFDESEPEGSPYRYGNSSMMSDIVEISENNAINEFGLNVIIEALKLF